MSGGELVVIRAKVLEASCLRGGAQSPLRFGDVAATIEARTGVGYSISGATRLMRTLGSFYRKTDSATQERCHRSDPL